MATFSCLALRSAFLSLSCAGLIPSNSYHVALCPAITRLPTPDTSTSTRKVAKQYYPTGPEVAVRAETSKATTTMRRSWSTTVEKISRSATTRLYSVLLLRFFVSNPMFAVSNAQQTTAGEDLVCIAPTNPRGLAVHSSGSLFVLDSGQGVVLEYDSSDGQFVGDLTITATSVTVARGGLQADGKFLFVSPGSDNADVTVEKLDVSDGQVVLTFPTSSDSSVDETINAPSSGGYDTAIDADGTVYVSDFLEMGVFAYNGTNGEYLWRILEDTHALGIAFGPDDILYATVNEDNTVQRYLRSPDGTNFTLIDAFINGGSGTRVRQGPYGIAVNSDGYLIYVCWADSKEVTEYSQSGAELRWWEPGSESSETTSDVDDDGVTAASNSDSSALIFSPWYVALDESGDIYVSASDDGEGVPTVADVFKYDGALGEEIGRFSTCFGAGSTLSSPPPATTPSPLSAAPRFNTTVFPTPSPSDLDTPSPSMIPTQAAVTAAPAVGTPGPSSVDEILAENGEESNGVIWAGGRRYAWVAITATATVMITKSFF